ncbi:hypothetical protein MHYP_G00003680 [Metynnis hypsauchen]
MMGVYADQWKRCTPPAPYSAVQSRRGGWESGTRLRRCCLARKIVPALRWPFPVIVQCCETEKAMCVDAKNPTWLD